MSEPGPCPKCGKPMRDVSRNWPELASVWVCLDCGQFSAVTKGYIDHLTVSVTCPDQEAADAVGKIAEEVIQEIHKERGDG